jgi:hypothetical protein
MSKIYMSKILKHEAVKAPFPPLVRSMLPTLPRLLISKSLSCMLLILAIPRISVFPLAPLPFSPQVNLPLE